MIVPSFRQVKFVDADEEQIKLEIVGKDIYGLRTDNMWRG